MIIIKRFKAILLTAAMLTGLFSGLQLHASAAHTRILRIPEAHYFATEGFSSYAGNIGVSGEYSYSSSTSISMPQGETAYYFYWGLERLLEPNTTYRLSASAIAPYGNVDGHLGISFDGADRWGIWQGRESWQQSEFVFTTPDTFGNAIIKIAGYGTPAYLDEIEIFELAVESIRLIQLPRQLSYYENQPLDLAGMIIEASYVGESHKADIPIANGTKGVSVSGFDPSVPGRQQVTVTYKGASVSFEADVYGSGPQINGLTLVSMPDKVNYFPGEAFDLTGMKFYCDYENGYSELVYANASMADASAFDNSHGQKPITINYEGKTLTFYVNMIGPGENFTVAGSDIYDPFGNLFVPIGTNINGPMMFAGRDPIQDADVIANTWRFNTVRLVTYMGKYVFVGNIPSSIDQIVEAFTKRGIVVKIEFHDYTGSYPTDTEQEIRHSYPDGFLDTKIYTLADFADNWLAVAERHKDNPYVWFNIMNEPGSYAPNVQIVPDWGINIWQGPPQASCDMWYSTHKYVIDKIRGAGIENVIVLDEHYYGQGGYNHGDPYGPSSAILNKGPQLNTEYDNLVYSLHPYHWTNGDQLRNFTDTVLNSDLALMFGEYGTVFENRLPGFGTDITATSTKNVFDIGVPRNVGRLYWMWAGDHFCVTDPYNPVSRSGMGYDVDRKDGVNKPSNLTWFGNLIWDDAHGNLNVPVRPFNYVEPGLNLVPNGNFSGGTSNWAIEPGSARLNVETNGFDSGINCLNITPSDYGNWFYSNLVGMETGKTYEFSFWARGTAVIYLGSMYSFSYMAARIDINSTDWQFYTVTYTAGGNFQQGNTRVVGGGFQSPVSLALVSIVEVEGGSTPGPTPTPPPSTPIPTVPPTPTPTPVPGNLIRNGGFDGTANWVMDGTPGFNMTATQNGYAEKGLNSLDVTVSDFGNWVFTSDAVNLQQGKTYDWSFYAKGHTTVYLGSAYGRGY
ncbi:MAG: cellulase family glycosylhydrolase, partial [Defluviitaleaceae bacterium]|nr:cellulase family glycosylhydrolase [Defluviitaleaceae bacterium]